MELDPLPPACIVCGCDADMDSPADLCEFHWNDWFEGAIEIDMAPDGKKSWRRTTADEVQY